MTLMPTIPIPISRPLTYRDLEAMFDGGEPDDGHRYELIDGVLIVSPAPTPIHQRAVFRLARLLEDACPDDLEVFVAPLDVLLADDTVLEPDVLVARRKDLSERNLPAPPVLAVEVLSPSTRRFDYMLKRSRYEAAGMPAYWVVDPAAPSLTAWELRDGCYVEVASVTGEAEYRAVLPYPVTVVSQQLVAERARLDEHAEPGENHEDGGDVTLSP
jgi:Uma2 family endonuclease